LGRIDAPEAKRAIESLTEFQIKRRTESSPPPERKLDGRYRRRRQMKWDCTCCWLRPAVRFEITRGRVPGHGETPPGVPNSASRSEARRRRQAMRSSSEIIGASRSEAPEEMIFLFARRGSEALGWKSEARRLQRSFQEGPWNIGWLWLSGQAPIVERQASLREAQSIRWSVSSSEGAVGWEATPELVSLDFVEEVPRDLDDEDR
jgi:hypothetical protein